MSLVTILLVEDESSVASFITEELKFEDYHVLYAPDGEEALRLFEQNQATITLILLDWMLPKYDGLTVARRIRKKSQVPIIIEVTSEKTHYFSGGMKPSSL